MSYDRECIQVQGEMCARLMCGVDFSAFLTHAYGICVVVWVCVVTIISANINISMSQYRWNDFVVYKKKTLRFVNLSRNEVF